MNTKNPEPELLKEGRSGSAWPDLADAFRQILESFLAQAQLRPGDLVVVGCSTSEVNNQRIGSEPQPRIGRLLAGIALEVLGGAGLLLAAQCCEHLNRALIVERETALRRGYEIVNAKPRPEAGGSFASAVYAQMTDPVAVERIACEGGIDIGDTLIGMHLRAVAVPLRLLRSELGGAHVTAAMTRPKYIGGPRTQYADEDSEVKGLN